MRLLLAGDIHIGRTSTRLPGAGGADGATALGARAVDAWDRIVELAITERCGLVLLSGDVTDMVHLGAYWEAIGPLERGVSRLSQHGIRTIAVSGNHDFSVLTRLADSLDREHFTLIGRGGVWERLTIVEGDRAVLHLDGWSFPSERVTVSPLESYGLAAATDAPTLGIVHGDLDAANSPYAPLNINRLGALPPQGWLLGHLHVPRLRPAGSGSSWVLYPGSPQALDPGESGAHGVWLLECRDGHLGTPRHVPLSSVWYEDVDIDVSSITDPSALEPHLRAALARETARIAAEAGPALRQTNLRLTITGATTLHSTLDASLDALREAGSQPIGGHEVLVERITDATTPELDLREAARSPSALGLVARVLLELDEESASAAVRQLIERTRQELDRVQAHANFAVLENVPTTERVSRDHLRAQGRRLLAALSQQLPVSRAAASAGDCP